MIIIREFSNALLMRRLAFKSSDADAYADRL